MRNFYESEDYDVVLKLQHKDNSEEAKELIKFARQKYEELFCCDDEL